MTGSTSSGAWNSIAGTSKNVSVYVTYICVTGAELNVIRKWLLSNRVVHRFIPAGIQLGIAFESEQQQLLFELKWSEHCVS